MKVMVTGHRPPRLHGNEAGVRQWLNEKIKELKPDWCVSGMATGADQIWAECVIQAGIPLCCYFPFPQNKMHPALKSLVDKAAEVRYCCDSYSKAAYFIRDKAMVDNSDVVLVVWDGQKGGGTYITMEYAKKQGKEVYILDVSE